VYSWDIIAERVENELFLDKREKSSLGNTKNIEEKKKKKNKKL
jgi:hypothetical protein